LGSPAVAHLARLKGSGSRYRWFGPAFEKRGGADGMQRLSDAGRRGFPVLRGYVRRTGARAAIDCNPALGLPASPRPAHLAAAADRQRAQHPALGKRCQNRGASPVRDERLF
jgi:hypothetical protein